MRRLLSFVVVLAALAAAAPSLATAAVSPAGLTGIALAGAVDLAWQPVPGVTTYNVYRGTSAASVTTPISPVGGVAATGFTDAGAVNGTTYYYAVKPVVAGAESGSSAVVQATPRARSCSSGNAVVLENCYPGDPGWKLVAPLAGAALGMEAFATAASIARTESVDVKVDSAAGTTFRVEVFRSGYYGGAGARLFSVVRGVVGMVQPACTSDAQTGLLDCSTWATTITITTTASWPSGVYLLRLVRDDNGADTHVLLVVRDDARNAAVRFGVGFTTYEAYNNYGGKSLYSYNSSGAATVAGTARAVKVSFDRPFVQPRDGSIPNWYPRNDYPVVSWLESQGYDVSYVSDSDLETRAVGSAKAYVTSTHDEYVSSAMRAALQTARDAGVGLFFSGSNSVYWKIRFESGPGGGSNRVVVCYKSIETGGPDPSGIPTTLWREPAVGRPENALVGQMYVGDKDGVYFPLVVSAAEGGDRIWRYTGLDAQAPGASTSIGAGLVGWEWDARNTANGAEPAGVKTLATSSVTGNVLTPNFTYVTGAAAPTVTKYRAASGALVFATGTNHWAWGLARDVLGNGEPDRRIQQATTNVLADMGATPATPSADITLDSTVAPRVASTVPLDAAAGVAPTAAVKATFSRPMDGATITGSSFTLKAPDGSSVPATVSYDAATTTATLAPSAALSFATTYTARIDATARASDGTALQTASTWIFTTRSGQSAVRINVGGASYIAADGRSFLGDQFFTGGNLNSSSHAIAGTSDPTLYQNERWGQFDYAIPVVNGAYDVVFHLTELYFGSLAAGCAGARVFALDILDTPGPPDTGTLDVCGQVGANAALTKTVYGVNVSDGTLSVHSVYGAADDPELTAIEVVPSTGPPPAPVVTQKAPVDASTGVATTASVAAAFSRAMDAATISGSTFTLTAAGSSTPVAATVTYDAATTTAKLTPASALANTTTYTAVLGATVKSADGVTLGSPVSWSFTTAAATPFATTVRINVGGAAYTAVDGRTFLADQYFTGGTTLASTAAIAGTTEPKLYQDERWGNFTYAIPVQNGSYDVTLHFAELYYTAGGCIGKRVFSVDVLDTAATPDVANLDVCSAAGGANTALVRTVAGVQVADGVLNLQSVYGSVDDPELVAIEVVPAAPAGPPTVSSRSPATGATGVDPASRVTATFSRAMDGTTVSATSFTLTKPDGSAVPAAVAYDGATTTASLTPGAALATSTVYTVTLTTAMKGADGAPLQSAVTWSFTTAAASQPASTVRINTGGAAYTAVDGRAFAADGSFSGGSTFASAASITGTTDPQLYQNERWGSFSYAVPVVNGAYDVTFHFVELYYTSGSCVGKRIFSMDIADTTTSPDIANLDVCAAAGGANKALVRTIAGVQVSDGMLNVQSIYGSVDDPEVAAIEITPSGAPPQPAPLPSQVGQWSTPQAWPLVAVHASLLPTGNVLAWDGFAAAPNSQRVWNPVTNTFVPVPYAVNIFCAGHITLADGRVLIAGGHQAADVGIPDTTIYDPSTGSWTAAQPMSVSRWYPTVTALGDGRALVFAGDNIVQNRAGALPPLSDASESSLPEVFDPRTGTWTDLTGSKLTSPLYPFMFLLSDGRVVDAGPDMTTRILDPKTWAWTTLGTSTFDGMSAVMVRPNKIMKAGSWADPDFNGTAQPLFPSRLDTGVLDMNAATPAWRNTAPMAFARSYANLTLLPDGTVLASGGMSTSDGTDIGKAVLPAEIWSPDTEQWTTVAPLANGREYHSTALLLPDGRVLMAGGGQLPGSPAVNQANAEIYSPPYLFKGARPTIASAPSLLQYGQSFTVQTPDAAGISKVSLIRLPSVTHGFDQDQRFQYLSFTAGAGSLSVTAPANGNLAPPGYYMLFVVNASGVPSTASMVRFPAPWEDAQPPTAPSGLAAVGALGKATLTWTAATDNVGVRLYDVYRGTASGFTPSPANRVGQTGLLSFTDTAPAGSYFYVVKAEDAAGNLGPASNEASATIAADTTAPTVSVTAPAGGATVSASVAVAASAADAVGVAGVQFKLDGANLGAEDTTSPYSVNWDTTAAANGAHTLTAVARDAAGNAATSAAVAVTVSNTAPPSASGLVASYNFDAGSGTALADVSGHGNNGTIAAGTWSTAGHTGGALSFNGTSTAVTIADSASLRLSGGMTLEAWVDPSALGTIWRTAVMKEQPNNLTWALYANTDTTRPSGHVFTSAESILKGTAALTLNAWAHLATTYDGTTLRLYVNGTQVATKAVSGAITSAAGNVKIGGNSIWGEWFKGLIDDVRIYNRALSAAEVQTDMNAPVTTTTVLFGFTAQLTGG